MELLPSYLVKQMLYLLLICSLCISSVFALHCYQCDSKVNPDCKEYFDHDNVDQLSVKPTECSVDAAEYCVKTSGAWGGVVGTQRFCSSRDMGNQCQFITYTDHDRVYRACIYTCQGEGCNSASQNSISHILAITFTFISSICIHWLL